MRHCSKIKEQFFRAAILISAYGDSPHLASQINSIIPQMGSEDILIVVDDGSRKVDWEPFLNINVNYRLWTRLEGMGSTRSYLDLLVDQDLAAKYYFLADQDDLWMPGKLEAQINRCQIGGETSILCCSHAWENFKENWGGKDVQKVSPILMLSKEHYCFETPAPGMTFCITADGKKKLTESRAVLSDYQYSLPHDRIICAVLACFAEIDMRLGVLVQYRQHDKNQIGAPDSNILIEWLRRIKKTKCAVENVRNGFYLAHRLYGAPERGIAQYRLEILRSRLRKNWFDNILVKLIILTSI